MNLNRDNSVTREFQSAFSQCNFTWEVRHVGYNLYTAVSLEHKGSKDFCFPQFMAHHINE